MRVRIAAGSTVAEEVPGQAFDENGTMIVPGLRFYASGDSLRSTDASGAVTTLGTTAKPHNAKDGPEDPFEGLTIVGANAWFYASIYDYEPAILWRSDGTVAGTHPAVTPGQIGPVASTLTIAATPRASRRAPSRLRVSGQVRPEGILPSTAAALCTGSVTITVTKRGGTQVLQRARVPVRFRGGACTFRGTIAPSAKTLRAGRGHLTIGGHFSGNAHVDAWVHVERTGVRYG